MEESWKASTNNRPFCRTDVLRDREMGYSFDFPCLDCTLLSLKNWLCSLEQKTTGIPNSQDKSMQIGSGADHL
jgi:hypothetical protein